MEQESDVADGPLSKTVEEIRLEWRIMVSEAGMDFQFESGARVEEASRVSRNFPI